MRPTPWLVAEPWGIEDHGRVPSRYGDDFGFFVLRHPDTKVSIRALASRDDDWEHVSVSLEELRCPTWDEMCFVKAVFFDAEECVMQLHPPMSEYRSLHPYCLHLWRPRGVEIPRPEGWRVAPDSAKIAAD